MSAKELETMSVDDVVKWLGFKNEAAIHAFVVDTITKVLVKTPKKYCTSRGLATIIKDSIATIPSYYYVRLSLAIGIIRKLYPKEYNNILAFIQLLVIQNRTEFMSLCGNDKTLKGKEDEIRKFIYTIVDKATVIMQDQRIFNAVANSAQLSINEFIKNPENEILGARVNSRTRKASNNATVATVAEPVAAAAVAGVGNVPPVSVAIPPNQLRSRSRSRSRSNSGSRSTSATVPPVAEAAESLESSSLTRRRSRSTSNNNSNSNNSNKSRRRPKKSRVYKWSPNRNIILNELEEIVNTPKQQAAKVAKAANEAAKKAALLRAQVAASRGINFSRKRRRNAAKFYEKEAAAALAAEELLQKNAATKNSKNVFRRAHEPPTINVKLANPEKPPTF